MYNVDPLTVHTKTSEGSDHCGIKGIAKADELENWRVKNRLNTGQLSRTQILQANDTRSLQEKKSEGANKLETR